MEGSREGDPQWPPRIDSNEEFTEDWTGEEVDQDPGDRNVHRYRWGRRGTTRVRPEGGEKRSPESTSDQGDKTTDVSE